ncbi:msl3084 [Mesorhizobium japonicum MAFF 303099]|uniref:Msl3084 protein n=1 Tax=Mesorhizobium japonicum (strain LMG 29417 / CECT 9101 / MAFF 303099) TaxID=266835 RepID=Q98H09_RHILO|nr:msl3084 [Mesorhizobium japonicum MAFF 303099]
MGLRCEEAAKQEIGDRRQEQCRDGGQPSLARTSGRPPSTVQIIVITRRARPDDRGLLDRLAHPTLDRRDRAGTPNPLR